MEPQTHWENIYHTKSPTQVSWYQEHSELSLRLIQLTGVEKTGHIIDIGGGASVLADELLTDGFQHISVLDISATALQTSQERLGDKAQNVTWIEADITEVQLPLQQYDVWHDRATFHFLTSAEQRQRYIHTVQQAVKPGGHVIVATFALNGPTQCSGLDVIRYDPESLHHEFGDEFRLVKSTQETHKTPWGNEQPFVYCYCRIA